MSKLETHGYKKYWPMKQLEGVNADGSKRATEGFRNMESGEFHVPGNGWSGSPPDLPPGEKVPDASSDLFKKNYVAVFGHE